MFTRAACLTVFVMLGLGTLTGCTTWRGVSMGPIEAIESGRDPVRVSVRGGETITLHDPRIEGDSIVVVSGRCRGIGEGRYRRYVCPTEGVAALRDIEGVEVQEVSRARSLLLLSPVVAISAVLIGFSMTCSSSSIPSC